MKRSEIWNHSRCAVLVAMACQAPDAGFFDRRVSPRPTSPLMGPGTLDGMTDSETGPADPATGLASESSISASSGSRPAIALPGDDAEPTSSTDADSPSASEPDESPAGDEGPGLAGPSCETETCEACRNEGRCEAGLSCHPQAGVCAAACASGDDCDAVAGTPLCTGATDSALGLCVECETDPDCVNDDLPACDVSGACVECTSDAHCADQGSDRIVCDSAGARCVECVTAVDCDADNPVCVDGECEEED